MKKYKVWCSIDQAYLVEAENAEEAREKLFSGIIGDEAIIEEKNQEWLSTEEIENIE